MALGDEYEWWACRAARSCCTGPRRRGIREHQHPPDDWIVPCAIARRRLEIRIGRAGHRDVPVRVCRRRVGRRRWSVLRRGGGRAAWRPSPP